MKGKVMSLMVKMEPELLKDLVTEVKETIATDIQMSEASNRFTIVDMWNIRRNSVSAKSRFRG